MSALPAQSRYIIGTEACERFSFYGMKSILMLYMTGHLLMSEKMCIRDRGKTNPRLALAVTIMFASLAGVPLTAGFFAKMISFSPGLGPARCSLARFGGRATLSRWRGYYGTHVRTLIWRLSFAKCFFSIFFTRKCVPNRF